MTLYDDPLESADNPEVALPRYYGQAIVDAYYASLVKGVGKVPFDPAQHTLDKRVTAIKIGILPIAEQNVTRDVFREFIAEFGAWPLIMLPSMKAVGLTTKSLNGAWVCLELVREGRTYTDKNTGEQKDSLTFKVAAVYRDEEECRNAYLNQTVASGQEPSAPVTQPPATPPTNGNGHNGNGNGTAERERANALQFVKALLTQVNGDEAALAQRIAGVPAIAKHFTAQSQEVRALLDAWHFEQLQKVG